MQFGSWISSTASRLLMVLIVVAGAAAGVAAGNGGSARAAAANEASKTVAAKEAEGFVQTSIDAGYLILNNKALSKDERQMQFRVFLLSLIDTKRVALFTVGAFARAASESEIAAFVTAYNEFATAMYQGYFDWYTGQVMRVASSSARSADDVVVYADVVDPKGARFRVGFRVRKDETQRLVVTDFQFEGVWLALTQRADFTAYLQQHGGDFAALVAELEKRTQRFREVWAPPTQTLAPPIAGVSATPAAP